MDYYQKYIKYKVKYLELKRQLGGALEVPTTIMDRETILQLIATHAAEIPAKFSEIHKERYDTAEKVGMYKQMMIDLYLKLTRQFTSYSEDSKNRYTIVSVGNTPYKVLRLIELLYNFPNRNIDFIYIPFSGKFKEVKIRECNCRTLKLFETALTRNPNLSTEEVFPNDRDLSNCTVIRTPYLGQEYKLCHWTNCELLNELGPNAEYMKKFVENPARMLEEQYRPEQLHYFEQMINSSGLREKIVDNNKIILVDFLEGGIGFLSFLMTLDRFLTRENTSIISLSETNENGIFHVYTQQDWQDRRIISDVSILGYPTTYIPVDIYTRNNYELLLADQITDDRCVKSYKKEEWQNGYENYSVPDITKCNIGLLNIAVALKQYYNQRGINL